MMALFAFLGTRLPGNAQTAFLDVTNFGARGDAVQIWANTVSNSAVVTISTPLGNGRIGELMQLFGVGSRTIGTDSHGVLATNNQDLVAKITNVLNGTNVILNVTPQRTATNVFCLIGTNNAQAFQVAVDAAVGPNTVINIPPGNYMIIPQGTLSVLPSNWWWYSYAPISGVVLNKGGITFRGAGTNSTTITGRGAWQLDQNGNVVRGFVFLINGPCTNNYPVVWDNMTLDGGLSVGNTGNYNAGPANPVDGDQWDMNHSAILVGGNGVPFPTNQVMSNCRFTRWRGEMVKQIVGQVNQDVFILTTNCCFYDGNASAWNFNTFAHDITHCTFDNLHQVLEFYQACQFNHASYFQNNWITNITGNVFAINGANTNSINPPYYFQFNRVDYTYAPGGNAFGTTPAQNVFVLFNTFNLGPSIIAFALGEAGAQGTAANSNIVIAGNSITGCQNGTVVSIQGYGPNYVDTVKVYSNYGSNCHTFYGGYGAGTNIHIWSNKIDGVTFMDSKAVNGPWALIDLDNEYYPYHDSMVSGTNLMSYGVGPRHSTVWVQPGVHAILEDSPAIPDGAMMLIDNTTNYGEVVQNAPAGFYLHAATDSVPLLVTNGQTVTALRTNGIWRILNLQYRITPPANFRVTSTNP